MDDLVKTIKEARSNRSGHTAKVIDFDTGEFYQRSEKLIWASMRRASIVVIDDVAIQTPRAGSPEESIVDKAADVLQHCRTICTSNIKPVREDEGDVDVTLSDVYDDRVASRLLANGVAREWPSARLRNANLEIQWTE